MNEPRINIPEWTVSELATALKRTVEDNFGYVRVRGEISGYRGAHSSGHCYFALKDQNARIDAVVWKAVAARLRIKPEDGLEVVATGRLTTYPGRSTYQIVIESLEPAGLGALMALLEERKKKLAAEGLFDQARKQPLPYLPEIIGVITSPTGAVIRDILHRLGERFPRAVLLWPVRVQGDGSAEEIAAAIRGFNMLPRDGALRRPDLLIVARGGGSIEDLWSFNEETVVRAAAESVIPLISAVGHETDVTLLDFVADKRAPTPTAAAEIAVPVRAELISELAGIARRALACWQRGQDARRVELRAAVRALPGADHLLAIPRQRLDAAFDRLPRALRANAQQHHTTLSRIASRLAPQVLRARISRERERVAWAARGNAQCLRLNAERRRNCFETVVLRLRSAGLAYINARREQNARTRERTSALQQRARRALRALLEQRTARVERAEKLLAALSYREVLARGFALVREATGRRLRAAAGISVGLALDIEFNDGHVAAVTTSAGAQPARAAKLKTRRGGEGQGRLF